MFRDFATVMKVRGWDFAAKDMTSASVHVVTAIGNEKAKSKYRPFKAVIAETAVAKEVPVYCVNSSTERAAKATGLRIAKRTLHPNGDDGATAKSPFLYDPNALGSLRPDQVPRFFGALTDSEKLPTKEVKLDELHAMQDRVDPAKVKAIGEHGAGGKPAVVVQHNGKHYIADGHHRLAADWLAGKDTATVAFKDLEPVDQALKAAPDLSMLFSADDQVRKIAGADEGDGIVYGWGIVSTVNGKPYYDLNIDHAGPHAGKRVPEHIPDDGIAKMALAFYDSGAFGNEMHAGPDRGDFPFQMPITKETFKGFFGLDNPPKTGLALGYRPPPDVLEKFKSGEYTGFSIEGARLAYTEHEA